MGSIGIYLWYTRVEFKIISGKIRILYLYSNIIIVGEPKEYRYLLYIIEVFVYPITDRTVFLFYSKV